MIRWVRTAQIAPGKQADAMAFAQDICAHAESVTGTKVNFFVQHGGPLGRVCWQSDLDGLGDYEKQVGQLQSDEEFGRMVTKAGAARLFIAGQARDSLWSQT